MTQEQKDKYKRLTDRLAELADLNGKIGRLCFYLNEDAEGLNRDAKDSMLAQIGAMYDYQGKLERRIRRGWY